MGKILVPVRGTRADDEAIKLACTLAKRTASQVSALYVIEVKRSLPLDAEVDDSGPEAVCAPFARQSQADRTALVILGGLCRRDRGSTDGEFVPKPYHYGPLVRKIEALLSAAGQTYARSA